MNLNFLHCIFGTGGSSLMDEDQHIDLEERTNGNNGTTATKEPSLSIANKSLWNCCPMCARNQNAARQGHQGTIFKCNKFILITRSNDFNDLSSIRYFYNIKYCSKRFRT